ncbi:MAG: NAD-dependent dehydratase, partial [Wenzhouxiangellaceae bacterium]|nr:NAD-dependent dehydratase [Wenzhouxiangellaceae bacterium]
AILRCDSELSVAERELIAGLIETEQRLLQMAEKRAIAVTLLRPTLIYGGPVDGNISQVRNWLGSRRWAPVAGKGLRQPVHAEDLAGLIVGLLARDHSGAEVFDLGGGETLPYPDFIRRIASSAGVNPVLVPAPAMLANCALRLAHGLGRMHGISPAMVTRQRMDLIVDDSDARRKLGWHPRPFRP